MAEKVPDLCAVAARVLGLSGEYPANAAQVVNDAKVSDHHALLPTVEAGRADLATLPTGERNILHMIAVRLLCAVGEAHTYTESAAVLECGGAPFTAKGRTTVAQGWKAVESAYLTTLKRRPKQEEQAPPLPELSEGQRFDSAAAALHEGATAPPARFTEDTLLAAMEHASAEDFAKLEDVERVGLGTPATRAGMIERLVRSGFAERQKKRLVPTQKGMELIRVMPDQLKSAKLTAQWEEKLGEVERGQLAPSEFMAGIAEMLTGLVKAYAGTQAASTALSGTGRTVVGVCPRCGKNVVEGKKSFFCEGYHDTPSCGFAMWKNDRFFTGKRKELTQKIAAALLKNGRVKVTGLFSEKKGVLYDATIVLDDDGGKYVHYKLEFNNKPRKGT